MTIRWRLLIYACVSSDIVEEVWEALTQLASAETSPLVSTAALVDMPPSEADVSGLSPIGKLQPFTHARTLRHVAAGALEVAVDGLQGELRTGTPDTLRRFLEWGVRGRTDERLALVLVGHGQAWQGFARDEVPGETPRIDVMLPFQLDAALEAALRSQHKGRPQLDLLGLCSCNMAALEVMAWLHPHAHAIIASQDIIYTSNWNLRAVVETLARRHDSAPEDLGASILDCFPSYNPHVFEKPEEHPQRAILSVFTLIRAEAVPPLLDAVSQAAAQLGRAFHPLSGDPSAASAVSAAREECDEFNSTCWGGGRGECGAEARSAAQVDVRQFLHRLAQAGRPALLSVGQRDSLRRLEDAFGRAVLDMTVNPDLEHVGGLGVFFPGARGVYAPGMYRSLKHPRMADWGRFVLDQWRPVTGEESTSSILKKNEDKTESLVGFTGSYHPAVAVEPRETLAEERPLFGFQFGRRTLGVIPGHPFFMKELKSVYVPPWHNGDWHALDVGGDSRFIPILGAGLNRWGRRRFWVEVDAYLGGRGLSERRRVVLGFRLDLQEEGELAYVGVVAKTAGGGLTRSPIRLRPGDQVSFAAYEFNRDGGPASQFTAVPDGTSTAEPVDPGLSPEPMRISSRSAIRVVRKKLPQPSAVILGLERWRGSRVLLDAPVA